MLPPNGLDADDPLDEEQSRGPRCLNPTPSQIWADVSLDDRSRVNPEFKMLPRKFRSTLIEHVSPPAPLNHSGRTLLVVDRQDPLE
jgi:hypothetical protein